MNNSSNSNIPDSLVKTSNNQGLLLKEGDLFKIKCQADGNPIPKIDWFHNGEKLTDNILQNTRIEINGKLSTLIISKVGIKHAGNYSCTAHNNNGLLSKWAYVSVIRKYSLESTVRSSTPVIKLKQRENSTRKIVAICSQETCLYGSCMRQNNSSICKCIPSSTGINCDTLSEKNNHTEPCITSQNNKESSLTENKIFALISFGLLIVLVLLLISLLCFYKFRKRKSYIRGMKSKKLINTSTQVSGIFDSELNLSHIPDNVSSSMINFEKPFVNNYYYNEAPPFNSLILQKDARGPPSGKSCSSQDTSLINTTLIPKTILVSVNDNSYSLYNVSTINNKYCPNNLPPQMVRLENTSQYLCSSLDTENSLALNNYIGNIIPLPFSCNDPCCCLNLNSKPHVTSSFPSESSKPPLISLHSNPMEYNHTCTGKCNFQSINTFV